MQEGSNPREIIFGKDTAAGLAGACRTWVASRLKRAETAETEDNAWLDTEYPQLNIKFSSQVFEFE